MYLRPVFLIAACGAAALAQQQHHHHHGGGEQPPKLLPGMGAHSRPLGVRDPDAQKFFDQGLNMLYGFNRHEALRSFRRAAELAPGALLPHWGAAMAQGPHINMDMDGDVDMKAYCAAIEKGRPLREAAPAADRALFDAAATRCPQDAPDAYIAAMREAFRRFPDDLDAATLLAEALMIPPRWRWWTTDGVPAEGVEEAIRVLEGVLRREPQHPGANHFYIHAVESSPTPERAIPSAQRLMGIVPAAGHLVHMPGHIWLILGDYEMAAEVNLRAAQVDRDYMKATGVTQSAYVGYYVHNLHFVAVARAMQGRKQDALKAADTLVEAAMPHIDAMAMMVDAFTPHRLFAMLRFQMWDEILAEKEPDARLLATQAIYRHAHAIALAAKGRRQEAAAGRAAFQAAFDKVPADWLWLNNKAKAVLEVAGAVLDARLAPADAQAVPHWRRAVELQDKLVYDEPPAWYYPVRESLGGALLRAGKASEAEAVFREGLRKTPRNGRMLFGLMESLQAQGNETAAAAVRKEFETAWKRADVQLTVAGL